MYRHSVAKQMTVAEATDHDGSKGSLRCGCAPWRGVVCDVHCQWQGCAPGRHTVACLRGERSPEVAVGRAADRPRDPTTVPTA